MDDADRVLALEDELARVRAAFALDLANAQTDVVAKNREIGRLKAELAGVLNEDSPEAADVKGLLTLWLREVKGGDKRVKADLKSTRAPKVRKAVKRRGLDICRRAVLGVVYDDWAMGRNPKTGGRTFNDIAEHILDTDDHIEKFAGLYDTVRVLEERALEETQSEAEESGPFEQAGPGSVGNGDAASLPVRPAASPRTPRRSPTPPINRVLDHLDAVGCDWRASTSDADSWQAQCPAHDDTLPSLSILRTGDGKVLLNCFAGCRTEDILARLCLEWRDLWDDADWDPCRDDYSRPNGRKQLSEDAKRALRLIQQHLDQPSNGSHP